jgi:hypothetical protein
MIDSHPFLAPLSAFQIRYVDLPRDAVPARSGARARRVATYLYRAAVAALVAVTLALVVYGFASAQAPTAGDPVRGEFRLGPGNQQPPGYVIPLRQGKVSSDPQPGEFRVGPGHQRPPGVVVPL